ncbi:HAAS domain-containing protein [Paenibacillus sp. J2TS4]|uniref:HAAS signaling domain-containing protein n=1 Tax=Paenibacillus sp. J2TS4 TaxID=2807194 RepID=UPI001B15C138|nr:DUF1700 domain-containing protein [Paenibacillus sp. J2TS4]GIP35176.1 hypothetical protein J2TS4_43860 [Paenibacillus sp. J2TS4]
MTKAEFMEELEQLLAGIPVQDRREIMSDYEEHFEIGKSQGKNEAEIAMGLGSPKLIAKEMNVHYHIKQAIEQTNLRSTSRAVIASVGLGFFNLIFILGPFVAVFAVIIALFAAAGVLVVSPVLLFILEPESDLVWTLLLGVTCCSLGVLIGVGAASLSKLFFRGVLNYLRWNLNVIGGRHK